MPVRKFRLVEQMQRPPWRSAGDASLASAIAATWELAERVAPQRFPPGVYRHRSIESAERLRETWAVANFRRFWSTRGGVPIVASVSGPRSGNRIIQVSNDIQLVELGGQAAVERMTGEAALRHLQNLMSRHPEAFQEARREMAADGWKETHTVFVERTLVPLAGQWRPMSDSDFALAAYAESNSQGEITFWSADDGDNSTWEGTIHVEIYADGAASTWKGQIDDSTTDYPWIYYRKTWERAPIPKEAALRLPNSNAGPTALSGLIFALAEGNIVPADFYGWAVCWRACVVGNCVTAAIACRFAGPAWPGCFGYACVGSEVGCGVQCYYQN